MNVTKPSQDERTMAALAHGSAILFGMGAIAAILIWMTQKEKSRYVAFQALQATAYQLAGVLVSILSWCCWTALYFLSFIPLIAAAEASADPPAVFWLSMFLMFVPMGLMGLWILGGLWGAVRVLQGREFRYILIGQQLERWMSGT